MRFNFDILLPIVFGWNVLLSTAGLAQYTDIDGRPSVTVFQGTLLGTYHMTQANTSYVSFEGIPFAKPPLGELRFRAPLPAGKWTGVLNATQPKSICPQNFFGFIIGNEDCLFINVYAPADIKEKTLPVAVYIHGGGFSSGSSGAIPEFIIDKGIIVFTISYRLGVLGFLCLDTKDVPGNAGMKDQVLGLKWVKQNAKYFRGDAENISVYGESSGAASVELHQISPMSKGLFQKAIAVAGSALCGWAIQNTPINKATRFGAMLGLNPTSSDFLNKLQALDANAIALAGSQVQPDVIGSIEDFVFTPVVEKKFCGVTAFLSKQPIEYYKSLNFSHIPTIIGRSSKEFTYFYELNYPIPLAEMIEKPLVIIPHKWQSSLSPDGIIRVFNEIREFFFKGQNITFTNRVIVESAIDLMSDIFIIKPVNDAVNILAEKNMKPVYSYVFSFRGVLNAIVMDPVGIQGATHTNEMVYLIQQEPINITDYSSDGYVRRRIVDTFTNFMIVGNPTPGPYSDLLPTVWKPATRTKKHYMEMNGNNIPSINPDEHRMKFWNELERRVFDGYYNK